MVTMKYLTYFLLILLILNSLATLPIIAGERHPNILPIEKVNFNWPPPREVGESEYFTIAK
ncbi:MAG: hypothetical protein QME62_07030, partial [Armatimonadota bacterium]|nr:hypothetical protein [Armatimonadota bacterium]